MKYACRNDPNIMVFDEGNYHSNESVSHYSLTSIHVTSSFSSLTNSKDVDGLSNTNTLQDCINSYVSEDDDV